MRVLIFGGLGNQTEYFENMIQTCNRYGLDVTTVDIHELDPIHIDSLVYNFILSCKDIQSAVVGFSSSCYVVAQAFAMHKSPNSRLLLIDPPYILAPGELPRMDGLHTYYYDSNKDVEIPKKLRSHILRILAPDTITMVFYRFLNMCLPLQWVLWATMSRYTPWQVDHVIYSMPIRDLQHFLTRFILKVDPVCIIEDVDPSCSHILVTKYPLSRGFIEKRRVQCVTYTDTDHHILLKNPDIVCSTLNALLATSTP